MSALHLVTTLVILLQAGVAVIKCDDSSGCRKPLTCITLSECTSRHRTQNSDLGSGIIFDCSTDSGKKGREVCCPPLKTRRPPVTRPIAPKPGPKPSPTATRAANMKLLPLLDCGLTSAERISSGENASAGQFPWMTLLAYRVTGNTKIQYLCGGSLINNRYVLTAAHCVNTTATLLSVRLGELNTETEQDCYVADGSTICADAYRDVNVEKVIVHPDYNTPYLKHDIALLRLSEALPSHTDYIRPICLPFGINITGAEEKKFFIAGWGKTEARAETSSPMLKFATITSSSIEDCNTLQSTRVHTLTNTQLCAGGATGEDACKGDSGGPLMDATVLPDRDSPQWIQLGIVSFGLFPCGSQIAPSVYTRVSAYLNWILDNIAK